MLYNFWIDLSGKLLDRKLGLTESEPQERKWIRIRSVLNYASNQATQCRKLLKLLALKLALKKLVLNLLKSSDSKQVRVKLYLINKLIKCIHCK